MKIIALFVFAFVSQAYGAQLNDFSTDNCSFIREESYSNVEEWQECCRMHDASYWMGGTKAEKKQTDQIFRECVSGLTNPVWTIMVYLGVRVGGTPYTNFPWKWGYGWSRSEDEKRSGYGELTMEEKEQVLLRLKDQRILSESQVQEIIETRSLTNSN